MSRLPRMGEIPPLWPQFQQMVDVGQLLDWRDLIPIHDGTPAARWMRRSPEDILGVCVHHTASDNDDPVATANYHTSPGEHITRDGQGCPTICYTIGITKKEQPPILLADPSYCVAGQGAPEALYPGDENRHLLAIVVFGRFDRKRHPTPSQQQRLETLLEQLRDGFSLDAGGFLCHADLGKPDCPGPRLYSLVHGFGAEDVTTTVEWQRALGVVADGIWGYKSRAALTAYQRRMGMRTTGTRDRFTKLRLFRGR